MSEKIYEATLELALLFEERSEDPCEHSAHETDTRWHGGAGEWLVRSSRCPTCFGDTKDFLFCDTYKVLVVDEGVSRWCVRCGTVTKTDCVVLGRKGVDF